jgi:hypothetical protein
VQEVAAIKDKRWGRAEIAQKMAEFEQGYQQTPSQRRLAEALEIPRTTLQHWLTRRDSIEADPEVVAFFESPVGVAFLHRLVLAAHFVMTLMGPCGVRRVCLFLELTGLAQFVAASYGPQRKVSVAMEEAVVEFGQEEKKRLAAGMKPKQITICEDETFHPAVCLVAIEPVSNLILLEQYADNRKAKTWTKALKTATEGLPIEVVQSTTDEGRGLLRHVEKDLGVHHSPDLFHVQQELVRGTAVALAGRKHKAEKALAKASKQVSRYREQHEAHQNAEEGQECPLELEEQLEQAQEQERAARQALETAIEHQERAKKAIQGINAVYHPYDLETGTARNAETVSPSLEQHFVEIEAIAAEANLPERCVNKIRKAQRVVVDMVATIAFFFLIIKAKVEALSLTPQVEQAVYRNLIPAIYLQLVADKSQDPEQRHALQSKSEELLLPLLSSDGPLAGLETQAIMVLIETVALECAQLFQRSSSCVEGRNGFLALLYHSLHRLSDRKLAALTTVHNFFVKRNDGSTPAERFFGSKPRDLFEWILEQVDLPGRPAQKRWQPNRRHYLAQVAA